MLDRPPVLAALTALGLTATLLAGSPLTAQADPPRDQTPTAVQRQGTGALALRTQGLPRKATAQVVVRGPDSYRKRIELDAGGRTLKRLQPGKYRLRPIAVDTDGSRYVPRKRTIVARVSSDRTRKAVVRYRLDDQNPGDAAQGALFTVTSAACSGTGTFADAIGRANANLGPDTVQFRTDVRLSTCPGGFLADGLLPEITETLVIEGAGHRIDGQQSWVDPAGTVNPRTDCPARAGWTMSAAPGPLNVGQGVDVTVTDLIVTRTSQLAAVKTRGSLTLERVDASRIDDILASCDKNPITTGFYANLTIRDSRLASSWFPDADRFPDYFSGAVRGDGGGRLAVSNTTFEDLQTGGAITWPGETTIVASRFNRAQGITVIQAPAQIVDTAIDVDGSTHSYDRIQALQGAQMKIVASTITADSNTCSACRDKAMPLLAQFSRIELQSSAVAVRNADPAGGPTLGDAAGTWSGDKYSWVQPTAAQPAADVNWLLPDVRTAQPGLPIGAAVPWPTSVGPVVGTPNAPGVLVDQVPDAGPGGANELLNPLNGAPLATDAFGNERVYSDGKRDIGAVQIGTAPHLAVTTTGDGTVQLGWIRPLGPAGTATTGYKLYWREAGSSGYRVKKVDDPATTSATVSGLRNGVKYEFYLVGVTSSGDGSRSNTVTATPLGPFAAPQPTAHSFDKGVQLTWSAPASGGRTITSYSVVYRVKGRADWLPGPTVTTREATVTGLVNGTAYEFGVAAASADGAHSGLGTASGTPTAVPAPPRVTATATGPTTVSLTWTKPDPGGSPITGYAVQYRRIGDSAWRDWPLQGTGTSTRITGLEPGVDYEFHVRAVNANGDGAPSTAEARTTQPPAPRTTKLRVDARAKNRPVPAGRTTAVITKVGSESGARVTVKRTCTVKGARAAQLCRFDYSAGSQQLRVKPRCATGIKVVVRISAKAANRKRTTWSRSWRVRATETGPCATDGNG